MKEEELTYKIRGCVYEVSRELGAGFLEQVYKNALLHELSNAGLKYEAEKKIPVQYKGAEVGRYAANQSTRSASIELPKSNRYKNRTTNQFYSS